MADESLVNAATRVLADELADRTEAYASLGFHEVERRMLAIRGDRFALAYQQLESDEGRITAEVRLAEVDESGRAVRSDVYDDRELPRALADLDARYRSSGAATEAELTMLDALEALNRREWDGVRTRLEPDLVALDHQRPGSEPAGRLEFVDRWMAGLVDVVPDVVAVPAEIRGRGPAVLARIATVGTTVDGDAHEREAVCVARFGAGARIEIFPLDRRADAVARFDEWSGATGAPASDEGPLGDEAGLVATALWIVLDRHEIDVLDRVVTPTVTFDDHVDRGLPSVRSAVQLGRVLSRLFELAPDTRFVAAEPEASGAAAVLDVEQRSTAPSGTEYRWERVVVVRCGPDGRIDAVECFPTDRRAEAAERFDEWRVR